MKIKYYHYRIPNKKFNLAKKYTSDSYSITYSLNVTWLIKIIFNTKLEYNKKGWDKPWISFRNPSI